MDLKYLLDEIEQADPEVYERLSPRRRVLRGFGGKVAAAALPFALGSMFQKAYGKTTDIIIDTLNFALQLEYLEFNFYRRANTSGSLAIPSGDQLAFSTIENHERAHVNFLRAAISGAGGTAYTPPGYIGDPYVPAAYDFTAGGMFPVFSDYGVFLTVSQAFEDTGVRAYKGQAGNLMSNNDILTAALQIHSVEARHASHLRLLRRRANVADNPKPWVTGNTAPAAAVQPVYAGEETTTQLTVDIGSLNGVNGMISNSAATESFDEPLTMAQVVAIVTPFLVM